MSAAAYAIRAAEEAAAQVIFDDWVERAHDRANAEEAYRTVEALILRSPLPEWFPGAEWEVYVTSGHLGTGFELSRDFVPIRGILVPADRPAGTNPLRSTITLGIGEVLDTSAAAALSRAGRGREVDARIHHVPTGEVRVYWATEGYDSETYTHYWSHTRVRSAADIGQKLQDRRTAAGDGWLGE